MVIVLLVFITVVSGPVAWWIHKMYMTEARLMSYAEGLEKSLNDSEACYSSACAQLEEIRLSLKKTVSQKKSSEVRTGLIVEQMAPFLEGFPYDPKSSNFLAKPIDFVVFDDTGVHFVEVKSGNAQLSSTQRKIRDQIQRGEVTFEVYRIKGE